MPLHLVFCRDEGIWGEAAEAEKNIDGQDAQDWGPGGLATEITEGTESRRRGVLLPQIRGLWD